MGCIERVGSYIGFLREGIADILKSNFRNRKSQFITASRQTYHSNKLTFLFNRRYQRESIYEIANKKECD